MWLFSPLEKKADAEESPAEAAAAEEEEAEKQENKSNEVGGAVAEIFLCLTEDFSVSPFFSSPVFGLV